ncbi:MAG: terpene cyclase/mutase family protein [Planctomyces sp.]|nr:terpene cyclase/mutase family protein [Planctomyces sp.]
MTNSSTIRATVCSGFAIAVALFVSIGSAIFAVADDVSLDNVIAPAANTSDEPIAAEFSMERAAHFLDSASLTWQKERKCFTCHTNYAYLYARPMISADTGAHQTVRAFAEELVNQRWPESGPRWDAEVVATAAALAFNDSATTAKLHPTTKTALDRMWTLQKEDGGWSWLKCEWPPMESDDHYGVTLAAIAAGVAPDKYSETDAAKKGLEGIRRYLKANPAPTLHHEAMVLWASRYVDGLLTDEERQQTVSRLISIQKPDGGWALATLGTWERGDDKQQDLEHSDGYGTGFIIYVLRQAQVEQTEPSIQRGISWLKANQRESGRWYTRSLFRDNHHFISHAGSAMAVMALSSCGVTDVGAIRNGNSSQTVSQTSSPK